MNSRLFYTVTVLFFIIECLLCYCPAEAIVVSGKTIEIPSAYATVKEVFDTPLITQNRGQTIIHIQDAHCNYEAQKNMAHLLDYLAREHKLRLIMVEGGSGNVSLSFMRGYADRNSREDIADKYLKEGNISGEEYLDIVSDYGLELYGIEDEELYDTHLDYFLEVDSIREEGLKYIGKLSYISESLKHYIYTQELNQLEQKRQAYKDKNLSLLEYCQYLKKMADKKRLKQETDNLMTAFLEIATLEKEMDFKQAEIERKTCLEDLTKALNKNQLGELINRSNQFKAGKLTKIQYYVFLKSMADKRLNLKDYPAFNSYIRYITISQGINAKDLLAQISETEDKIKEAFFINNDQRQLSQISKWLELLKGLLNLELTPEQYGYLQDNRSKFTTASWVYFLTENSRRYNLGMSLSRSKIIDDNLNKLQEFYQLGVEREKIFIKNLVNKMNDSREKLAVLITGGFHTPGITSMLKNKGYCYIVVTPVISKRADSAIYFSVLKGKRGID